LWTSVRRPVVFSGDFGYRPLLVMFVHVSIAIPYFPFIALRARDPFAASRASFLPPPPFLPRISSSFLMLFFWSTYSVPPLVFLFDIDPCAFHRSGRLSLSLYTEVSPTWRDASGLSLATYVFVLAERRAALYSELPTCWSLVPPMAFFKLLVWERDSLLVATKLPFYFFLFFFFPGVVGRP